MYNREMLKEIENIVGREGALKVIHEVTLLDFNKPFKVYKVTEPYTVNKLNKLYGEKDTKMFVINIKKYPNWRMLRPVQIIGNDFKMSTRLPKCNRSIINTYYRKLDFNDDRKVCSEDNVAFVFVIPETSLVKGTSDFDEEINTWLGRGKNKYAWELSNALLLNRFRIHNQSTYYTNVEPIGQTDLRSKDYTFSSYYYIDENKQFLDKSGYIACIKPNILKDTILERQQNKDKLELEQFKKSKEYTSLINSWKELLQTIITRCTVRLASLDVTKPYTSEEVVRVSKVLENMKYEIDILNNVEEKDFASIEILKGHVEEHKEQAIELYHNNFGNQSELSLNAFPKTMWHSISRFATSPTQNSLQAI